MCTYDDSMIEDVYPGNHRVDNIDTGSRYNPKNITILEVRKDSKLPTTKDIELNFSKFQAGKRGGL
jgi:hypothetical protein